MHTRWCTTHPAAAHLASVPPAPNSTSSGWAPIAKARRRDVEVDGGRRASAAASLLSGGCPGSFAAMPAAPVAARGERGRRACRCRGRARDRRAPRRGSRSASAIDRWRAERRRRRSSRRSPTSTGKAITFVPSRRRSGTRVMVCSDGQGGEVVGQRQVAVGDDEVVEALAGDRRPAGVDRTVEAEPGAPQHLGAGRRRPTPATVVVVARDEHRQRPAPPRTTRSASQRASSARWSWRAGDRQPALGVGERASPG